MAVGLDLCFIYIYIFWGGGIGWDFPLEPQKVELVCRAVNSNQAGLDSADLNQALLAHLGFNPQVSPRSEGLISGKGGLSTWSQPSA